MSTRNKDRAPRMVVCNDLFDWEGHEVLLTTQGGPDDCVDMPVTLVGAISGAGIMVDRYSASGLRTTFLPWHRIREIEGPAFVDPNKRISAGTPQRR